VIFVQISFQVLLFSPITPHSIYIPTSPLPLRHATAPTSQHVITTLILGTGFTSDLTLGSTQSKRQGF